MNNISVIQLNINDWQKYRDIRLDSLRNVPQAYAHTLKEELEYSEEKWRSRLKPYSSEFKQWNVFLLDKKSNRIIGIMGGFSKEEGVARIVAVYLKSEYRGMGLSKLMLNKLVDLIKATKSYEKLSLGVNKELKPAVNLYKSFGFKVVGKDVQLFGDGLEHDELIMERAL